MPEFARTRNLRQFKLKSITFFPWEQCWKETESFKEELIFGIWMIKNTRAKNEFQNKHDSFSYKILVINHHHFKILLTKSLTYIPKEKKIIYQTKKHMQIHHNSSNSQRKTGRQSIDAKFSKANNPISRKQEHLTN